MPKAKDLSGQVFGQWLVLYRSNGRYWRCRCLACNKTEKDIHASSLMQGTSTSCGCQHTNNKIKEDLSGQIFGNWKVIKYAGNGEWECECQCKNHTISSIPRANLLLGKSKSCGCLRRELGKQTLLDRYGEVVPTKVNEPREQWQIDTLENKELLHKYILDNFGCNKPTFKQLGDKLGVSRHRVSVKIHKYMLESLIDIDPLISNTELELHNFIRGITNNTIIFNDRKLIAPYELDIYIPDLKIAIEFNGTYWHSTEKIDKYYHQQKTIACAKKGVQLIHIFEYEWTNEIRKEKIKKYLYNKINKSCKRVYARNTTILEIDNHLANKFYDLYHFQNGINSDVNISLQYKNSIIAVISFSKPRFNNNYEYELTRLCYDSNYNIVGGTEKLFKYFINEYKPSSIITYCDISKFTGRVYTKLGFKTLENPITEPNYVWVDKDRNIILTRYQTQKHKLIENGLGDELMTEDEIMLDMGFYKVYDSGNLRMTWNKDR